MTGTSTRRQTKANPVVLQVLPTLETGGGGVERGTIDVALALKEAGYGSMVASAGGSMVYELDRAGIRHISLPLDRKNPLAVAYNAHRLASLVREHKIDIIHARSRAPAWSARRAATASGARFVTTFHGTYSGQTDPLKRWYNRIMTKGDKVIAISNFIAEHIAQYYAPPPDRVSIIRRGVDTGIFDPAKVSPQRVVQLANKWRLADGVPVIMMPGRLTRWKGQKVMIEALAHLGRKDLRCVLVGSDQGRSHYRGELENMVRRMNLSSVVHFTDHCADMPAAYMLADVVVSASTDPEGFGRVVAEAQALGKPVVVSDHGGAREAMWRDRTGWAFPPGDSQALAQRLEKTLSLTTEQREALGRRAIDYVRKHFTKRKMCDQTLALYRKLSKSMPAG